MKNLGVSFCILFSIWIMFSCNNKPSAEEMQRVQQAHDDSIRQATIANEKALEQKKEEEAAAKQKTVKDKETLMQILAKLDADRQGEEAKLGSVESFHLLRSSEEKEAEIKAQALRVNQIKVKIENVREQLQKLEKGEEYVIPEE